MRQVFLFASIFTLVGACAHQPRAASDPRMERMAQMHTDMAVCLRTNKSFEECHGKMMAECQKEGANGCPMMRAHMDGGKMGMMQPTPPPETEVKPGATDEHTKHHPEGTP